MFHIVFSGSENKYCSYKTMWMHKMEKNGATDSSVPLVLTREQCKSFLYAVYRSRKYIPLTFIFRSPAAFFDQPTLSFTWKTWSEEQSCHLPCSKQNCNIQKPYVNSKENCCYNVRDLAASQWLPAPCFLLSPMQTREERLPLSTVQYLWGVQRTDTQSGTWMMTWSDLSFI